jgi:hypothetical protein
MEKNKLLPLPLERLNGTQSQNALLSLGLALPLLSLSDILKMMMLPDISSTSLRYNDESVIT